MQAKEFLRFLGENSMPVFKLDDAAKILNCDKAYAKLFLHRCAKKDFIGRVERGMYYLKGRANEYEIASHILSHSYVTMVSSLYYYGLTTQIPRVVYVASTERHRPLDSILGLKVVFKKIRKEMLFGYHKESAGNVSIADPEKAVVDIFYFHDVNDLDEAMLEKPSRIKIDKLVLYAKRCGKRWVISGIAQLIKDYGYIAQSKELLDAMDKRVVR